MLNTDYVGADLSAIGRGAAITPTPSVSQAKPGLRIYDGFAADRG